MAETIHRDIYSGMVAEELNKQGYFGDAWERFFYLRKTDEDIALCEYETELQCVAEILIDLFEGKWVSDFVMLRKRVLGATDGEHEDWLCTARQEATSLLSEQQLISKNKDENQDGAIAILNRVLNNDLGGNQKILSGFRYQSTSGKDEYYTNAYLPNTWRKWYNYLKTTVDVGSITLELCEVSNQHPLAIGLQKFKTKLMQA